MPWFDFLLWGTNSRVSNAPSGRSFNSIFYMHVRGYVCQPCVSFSRRLGDGSGTNSFTVRLTCYPSRRHKVDWDKAVGGGGGTMALPYSNGNRWVAQSFEGLKATTNPDEQ